MPTARRSVPARADGRGSATAGEDQSAIVRRRRGSEATAPADPPAVAGSEAEPSEVAAEAASADAGTAVDAPLPDADDSVEALAITGPAAPLAPDETEAATEGAAIESDADAEGPEAEEAATDLPAEAEADAPAETDPPAEADAPTDGAAIRRATAAVRLATRPTWRRTAFGDGVGVEALTG